MVLFYKAFFFKFCYKLWGHGIIYSGGEAMFTSGDLGCDTLFNVQWNLHIAHTVYLRVSFDSHNKWRMDFYPKGINRVDFLMDNLRASSDSNCVGNEILQGSRVVYHIYTH